MSAPPKRPGAEGQAGAAGAAGPAEAPSGAGAARISLVRRHVLSLYQAIKVSFFHDFNNQAMVEPLAHFGSALEELIRAEGSVTLTTSEGHLFVNGTRVALSGSAFLTIAELMKLLEKKGLGGLRFEKRLDKTGVQTFLTGIHAIPEKTADGPGFLRSWLADHGGADFGIVGLKRHGKSAGKTVSITLAMRARLLYAKLLVLLREILGPSIQDAASENFFMSRMKRTLQEIVSTSDQAPLVYLGLINVKNYEDYVVNHSANVAVLSVLVGRRLGLDRREICELSVAAALHDIGKVKLPAGLLAKTGEFTPEERATMQRHPVEGVLTAFRQTRTLDRTTMARLVSIFEHNMAANGYPERRQVRTLHLLSRIISVVDSYDALTTARPYRRAFLPDEALGEIRRGSGVRFDAAVVKAFTGLLGIYPHGALVVLSGGEKAIVLHNDLSDVANPRPIVKVVIEADGRRGERILDLGEKDEKGNFASRIVGTDDPARYSISVAAYAAG